MSGQAVSPVEPSVHIARARDGWKLGLRRFAAPWNGGPSAAPPVLLVHGVMTDSRCFHHPRLGARLAADLASKGFDVWTLDFRGRGLSGPRGGIGSAVDWSFDDWVELDLPAAVEHVRAATGAEHVDLVGHSMGGVAAAVAAGNPALAPRLRRLVFLSANYLTRGTRRPVEQAWIDLLLVRAGVGTSRRLGCFASGLVPGLLHEGRSLALQLESWYEDGRLLDRANTDAPSRRLRDVRHPCLFVTSAFDPIASERGCRHFYDLVGSPKKTLLRVGGPLRPAGHVAALVGATMREEVLPPLTNFLRAP